MLRKEIPMNATQRTTLALAALSAIHLAGPASAAFDDVYFVQVSPDEVGTPIGYQTWRAVARFTDPTDTVFSVHGQAGGTPLTFFTSDPAGLKNLDDFCQGLHAEDFPTSPMCAAWDSYVTIGHTSSAGLDTETSPGFLGGGAGVLIQGKTFTEPGDEGWYDSNPGSFWVAGPDLEIVIAQFTVGVGHSVELGGMIDGTHSFSPAPYSEAFFAVGEPSGTPGWNRRVGALTTSASGSGGLTTIRVHVEAEARDISAPIDLSTRVLFMVNGIPVSDLIELDLTASPVPGDGSGPCDLDCDLGDVCYCHGFPPDCSCGPWIGIAETETPLAPGDEIMVLLRPSPGAAPEDDTSDDSKLTTYLGDQLYYNRRVEASLDGVVLSVRPVILANYDGRLRLGADLDVLVNDVLVATYDSHIIDDLLWSQCATVACDDTVACVMDPAGPYYGTCQEDDDGPLVCSCQYHPEPGPVPIPIGDLASPGDVVSVVLRPVPGALPELPGFEDDDIDRITVPPATCQADVDGNLVVDFQDLLAILAEWGPCAGCPEDIDGNDIVDFQDLLIVLATWGPCP
jgi:hypothetical protein